VRYEAVNAMLLNESSVASANYGVATTNASTTEALTGGLCHFVVGEAIFGSHR